MSQTAPTADRLEQAGPRTRPWKWLGVMAWLSFFAETIIIGTGGAVRLTGSGLGCTEWPLCTPESLVPTPAQGIHGIIEFGNRTMTGLVGILSIVVLLLVLFIVGRRPLMLRAVWYAVAGIVGGVAGHIIATAAGFPEPFVVTSAILLLATLAAAVDVTRRATTRRDLVVLAAIVLVGVVAQAFVGGITVLTGLNPFIVGFHYVASLLLVCVTAAFLVRMREPAGARRSVVPGWIRGGMHLTGLALVLTIAFGVLTTASGPHSGDYDVDREELIELIASGFEGFNATVMAHWHSWPGYILVALLAILTAAAWAMRLRPRRWLLALVAAVAVQIVVGVWQAREGLPEILVGIHMVLAALSAAAYTVVVLRMKEPVA